MNIISRRKIKFCNKVIHNKIRKIGFSETNDYLVGYVTQFRDIETIDEIIADLNHAISENFNLIEDPEIGTDSHMVFIEPTQVEFLDQVPPYYVLKTENFEDLKDLFMEWKTFLHTPPFDGTTAK